MICNARKWTLVASVLYGHPLGSDIAEIGKTADGGLALLFHKLDRLGVNMSRRIFALLACFVLTSVGALVPGAPAQAASPTCYGDYCSGTDPEATKCSADAYTVAHQTWDGWSARLELRWSPSCKTNWARVNTNPPALMAVQCRTGYTQAGVVANNGTFWWTRQIYSPHLTVRADWVGPPGSRSTACA